MKTIICLVILLAFSLSVHAEPDALAITDKFNSLVNTHRQAMGLKPLKHSEEISDIAWTHSRRMAQKRIPFGHMGSKLRCRAVFNELDLDAGTHCGENVAMGQGTPEEAFKAWLDSPEHREAIEDPTYTHAGLGFYKNMFGQIYWTQIFVTVP